MGALLLRGEVTTNRRGVKRILERHIEETCERLLKGFIPERACFSRGILAFSWQVQGTMSDRDSSGNAWFFRLFRHHCEISFGNLLSPKTSVM
jgi:hypothetical protein